MIRERSGETIAFYPHRLVYQHETVGEGPSPRGTREQLGRLREEVGPPPFEVAVDDKTLALIREKTGIDESREIMEALVKKWASEKISSHEEKNHIKRVGLSITSEDGYTRLEFSYNLYDEVHREEFNRNEFDEFMEDITEEYYRYKNFPDRNESLAKGLGLEEEYRNYDVHLVERIAILNSAMKEIRRAINKKQNIDTELTMGRAIGTPPFSELEEGLRSGKKLLEKIDKVKGDQRKEAEPLRLAILQTLQSFAERFNENFTDIWFRDVNKNPRSLPFLARDMAKLYSLLVRYGYNEAASEISKVLRFLPEISGRATMETGLSFPFDQETKRIIESIETLPE